MTLNEAAQTALDVQDACNLSGVLNSFHDVVMNGLWPEARRLGTGTEWVNTHCICTLFVGKLTDLNGLKQYSEAYAEVRALARGEEATS